MKPLATPAGRPVMKVSHIKANVASLEELSEVEELRVRELLDPEVLRAVAEATRSAWMPVEVDVEMTEAVGQVCGESGVRRWSRDALRRSIDGPLLGPVVSGAVRLFGLNPGRILSMIPRSIGQVYRGCGKWETVERTRTELKLRWISVPDVIADSRMALAGYAGAFEALLDVARVQGRISFEVRGSAGEDRIVEFDCRFAA